MSSTVFVGKSRLERLSRVSVGIGTLFALLLIVGCGSSAKSTATPDPRKLALKPSDFTEPFVEVAHRYWTSSELARRNGASQAEYDQHGLTKAYETSYLRLTHVGLARVADVVYQFHDQSGAEWFISRLRTVASKRKYRPFHFNVSLGDQMYAYVFHPTFNGLSGTEYIVYYRRNATVVSLIGAGQRVDSSELVPFVGSVDLRTKAAY